MSKTPRTDEQLKLEAFFDGIGIVETVEVEFAQQLEAELADKDRQLAEARAEIERLEKGMKTVQSAFKNHKNADAAIARIKLREAKILQASCNLDAVNSERAANEILTEELEKARADAEHWKAKCSSLQRMVHEARAENESLRFIVRNQRCCRNCDNHASWNFDTCGFGESPTAPEEGPHCRRNDLKRWRPMEYRRAKEERGE